MENQAIVEEERPKDKGAFPRNFVHPSSLLWPARSPKQDGNNANSSRRHPEKPTMSIATSLPQTIRCMVESPHTP
jgi:hypothetical protein